jgi:hypothetical protein
MLVAAIERAQQISWVQDGDGAPVRFGSQVAIEPVRGDMDAQPKVASYLAKYATKSTDGSAELARRFRSRDEIERASLSDHHRRLALLAWGFHRDRSLRGVDLRRHAHCFGFSGQHLTKSRGYSVTFHELRAARAEHMRPRNEVVALDDSFFFAGQGYRDPRGRHVAELIHSMTMDARREARAQRLALEHDVAGAGSESQVSS